MKFSLYKLLSNSCFRKKYNLIYIFIAFLSMYIMLGYLNITTITHKAISNNIIKDCGSFDYAFYDLLPSQIEQIKNLNDIDESCEFNYSEEKDENYIYKIYGTKSNFMKLSPYQIIKGEFPKNENEILCEPWLLRQKGIVSDDMIGEILEINNKYYTITGLCKNTSYITASEQNTVIITYSNKFNGIMLNCKNGSRLLHSVHNILQTSEFNYSINDAKLSSNNDQQNDDKSFIIVFIILLVSSIIIIINLITFMNFKLSDNINIILKLGIKPSKVAICMISVLIFNIIIANTLALLFSYFTSSTILKFAAKFNDILNEYTKYDVNIKESLLFLILISIVEIFIILLVIISLFKVKKFKNTYQIKKFYSLNPKKKFNNIFLSMGYNNILIGKKVSIFTIITLSISIVSMVSLTYYFSLIKDSNIKCDDIKYVISFDEDFFLNEEQINQKTRIIEEISSDPDIESVIQNMFFTTLSVPKDEISDDFKNILKKDSTLNAQIDNNINKYLSLPVGVISADSLNMENIETNVLYTIPLNLAISDGILPKEKESTYSIYNTNQENVNIKLRNIKGIPPKNLYSSIPLNIIILDNEKYNSISNYQKPSIINITNNVDENTLIYYTGNAPFCKIESLYENLTTVEKGIKSIISISRYLCIIYVCSIVINFLFATFLRLIVFRKEYRTVLLLGVNIKYIFLMAFFEVSLIIIPSLFISFILSFITTNMIFKFMSEEITVFLSYSFPYLSLLIFYIALLLIMLIALILFIHIVVKIKED